MYINRRGLVGEGSNSAAVAVLINQEAIFLLCASLLTPVKIFFILRFFHRRFSPIMKGHPTHRVI